ncbi:flavodoxin-dependent (E)-4-hydroxy-3-methylbut-2-enyl-diphosphate synthase [Caldinitratiruptor microaerophilus]|uniref:4-hydroxy-3-methylbut-2-en-1-yl diphosphate synthase (flavodoxin) n=1 Tax=Caldinitratiruptor microaerophilus TaxID=671077 RepID=A0AA35G5G7_9FIRM|nr:flavodoxin-dependent (E)-4-hydroxy-3-methylbut-2-enyl-diphosphate synthase [Caldinitratiruptor microaerophilus]BDG59386.1 4-hydroxy-3-methylbut-2-en-1-yl diphosphate synthase (flavodoxin) [Caldinitratiruptor microaerophilus]
MRKKTRRVRVGRVEIGGDAPISVQSMTKCDTRDVPEVLRQIRALAEAGCDIVRVAVPNEEAAAALRDICRESALPVVADIHFDYRLALKALEAGVDKLRLNPGNIGARWKIETVVREAKARGVPIRIGVNAGSLEKDILEKYGYPTPEGMVESALRHAAILEDLDFRDIVISVKASNVPTMIRAYRLLSEKVDYPLHLGVTEAGTTFSGTVKSAVGIGSLLADGIGDTIRVSLATDPVEEVRVGWEILRSLGLRTRGVNIVACPSCGRVQIDLVKVAEEVEKRLGHIDVPLNVAVMGCVVNGPGEAREADVALFGGKGVGMLVVDGEPVRRTTEEEMVDALVQKVEEMAAELRAAGDPEKVLRQRRARRHERADGDAAAAAPPVAGGSTAADSRLPPAGPRGS